MKKDHKKVSMIIPCYNAEAYLIEALVSVENQTYENIEVILIDDGSIDRTYEILKDYERKSQREVRVIQQKNGGVSSARNNGLKNATGNYICFMDCDDIISCYFVEKLVCNYDEDTYVCTYYSRSIEDVKSVEEACIEIKKLDYNSGIDYIMLRKRNINFCGSIYSRRIIDQYQIEFPEDLIIGEDNVFMWKYLAHTNAVTLIDEPLYGYRLVETSASFQKTDRIRDAVAGIQRCIAYADKYSPDLYKQLRDFMLARTKLAVAKQFVLQRNLPSLQKFRIAEWNKSDLIQINQKPLGIFVKCAALVLTISPKLFYEILSARQKGV